MSVEKAKLSYIGKAGPRLNCSQAVGNAFKEKFAVPDHVIEQFKAYGGGAAPDGICGAFYAVKILLMKNHPDSWANFEAEMKAVTGSMTCSEIRALRKLSCVGCVEKAAECLDKS